MTPRRWRFRLIWPRFIGAIVLGTAVIMLVWQGFLLAVDYVFPEPFTAVFGTIEIGQWVEAAFFRRESLILAPRDGKFYARCAEGERIARFGVIGVLKRAGRTPYSCRSLISGLIVYTCDGLEAALGPEKAMADLEKAFAAAKKSRPHPIGRGWVRRGQPMARLVQDEEAYLIACFKSTQSELALGGTIWAREEENLIPLTVAKVIVKDGFTWAVLRTNRFPNPWLGSRYRRLYAIVGRYAGILVPRRFVQHRHGRYGVIAMVYGRPEFLPVKVLAQNRHQAVVEGVAEGTPLMPR